MKQLLLIAVSCMVWAHSHAQNTALTRKISVELKQVPVAQALTYIEKVASISFAYNSDIFPSGMLVTGSFVNQELSLVLDSLLGKNYAWREKGHYIVLKSVTEIVSKNETFIYTISGYIEDAETKERIPFASVYDSVSLASTITDANGYYSLNLEQHPGDARSIGVSKSQYLDTFILIRPVEKQTISVALKKAGYDTIRQTESQDSATKQLNRNPIVKSLISVRQRLQTENIHINLSRGWQVSLLPFVGTHGELSGKIRNNFSLNIFGGYNGGFDGAEFGSLFNIDRDSCVGAQFGGMINLTAVKFRGGQFAGIANGHFGNFEGGQFGGIANVNTGNFKGGQFAGILNTNVRHFEGAQFGGIMNVNTGGFKGLQAAGILNTNIRGFEGVQVGGIANFSQRIQGSQIAGILNSTVRAKGTQIAGILNLAKTIQGAQIGLFNVADTVNGVQIGFLSFSRSGIHMLEYSYNDVMAHNITFRTGSKLFYNIIGVSFNPYPQKAFGVTYGVGSRIISRPKSALHINLSSHSFYLGTWDDFSSLARLSVYIEKKIYKHLSVMAGPDINFYYTNGVVNSAPGYKSRISYINPLWSYNFNYGRHADAWIGFHIGLSLN